MCQGEKVSRFLKYFFRVKINLKNLLKIYILSFRELFGDLKRAVLYFNFMFPN